MKKINLILASLFSAPFVFAGGMYGDSMYGGNMMYRGGYWGITGFILGSFVFSLIFWLVYLWLVKNNGSIQKGKARKK